MRPKRLISLLVAVCMMITMLPLSAVTAFATDTSTVHEANDDVGAIVCWINRAKKFCDGYSFTVFIFLIGIPVNAFVIVGQIHCNRHRQVGL